MIVPLLFFCSGATALVYEVMWSKYLSLLFGSTIQAQTVVLAVFMGGLALGNRLFGSRADLWRAPLPVYGYIEIAIGLYAFFFPFLYSTADLVFQTIGARVLENRPALLVLKTILSLGLLLAPTILMGGTLPLLASWLDKQYSDSSRWAARFYAINSLGAVLGATMAGFFLVPWLGLSSTLQATALTNFFIGLIAVAMGRRPSALPPVRPDELVSPSKSPAPLDETNRQASEVQRAAGPVMANTWRLPAATSALVFLTGGVSMGLEVLASRCLSLIFGASLQSFATVLIAFILGIGLGSFMIASPRWKHLAVTKCIIILLLLAAGWIGLIIFKMEESVDLYRLARTGLARTNTGYRYHQLLTALFSIVVLGIPAAFLGSVLPLCIRARAREAKTLADQVGRLLTANTLGCVCGVLITGFILMPHFGLRASFATLAMAVCAAAFLVAVESRTRWALALAPALAVVVLLVNLVQKENWKYVLSSGVFRAREVEIDRSAMEMRRKHIRILFYEDAADATVSVEQGDGIAAPDQISLRINGKVDATSRGDLSTQYLLAHLPMLAKPDSRDVFVLGLGSGITAGALLGHPIAQLVIAENCDPVVRAAKFFAPWNRGVVTNRLTRIWREDARTVLKLKPQLYDVIISEPSNPWMAGVGSVFSREFYALASSRLKPGGVMAQWFHIYEMHDGIIDLVLQTFVSVFPHVEIWDPGTGDVIMLGGKQPWDSTTENYAKVFQREGPRSDLQRIGLTEPQWVWARQLASQRSAFAIPDRGAMQSDEYPVLEYEAPKAFYLGQTSQMLFLFDERTWQRDLALPDKTAALAAMNPDNLKSVFAEFSSANTELMKFVAAHVQRKGAEIREYGDHRRRMPSLFPNQEEQIAALPENINERVKQIWEAESGLKSLTNATPALLDRLEKLLVESSDLPSQVWVGRKPADFALVAAQAALGKKDYARAGRLVLLGLQREPASLQLRYLSRILQREDPLAPSSLATRQTPAQ